MTMETDIIKQLENVKHVSLTSKLWEGKNRRLLITACHWIDQDMKRKSYIFSCRPFTGTYLDNSAKTDLRKNLGLYGALQDFKKFIGRRTYNVKELHLQGTVFCVYNFKEPNYEYYDRQQKCVLNELIRFCELSQADFNATFEKCRELWRLTKDPNYSGIIDKVLGSGVVEEPRNHYGGAFEQSLTKILSIENNVTQLYEALNLKDRLDEDDFVVIKEYLKLFKPVTEAIDVMINDKNLFIGIILPCLLALRKKLLKISNENYDFLFYKTKKYLDNFIKMFADYFKIKTDDAMMAAIAAFSYPRFKNTWFGCLDPDSRRSLINRFLRVLEYELEKLSVDRNEDDHIEQFFEFEPYNMDAYLTSQEKALAKYLNDDDTDISMLLRHKVIQRVFVKYNTPMAINWIEFEPFLCKTLDSIRDEAWSDQDYYEKMVVECNKAYDRNNLDIN